MKKILATFGSFVLTGTSAVMACEVCKKNQPKVLENITHGTGPTGTLDYIIIWSAVIIVSVTLFMSLKYLIKPKETNTGHIKNIVLSEKYESYGR